jgi:hypothetical protein
MIELVVTEPFKLGQQRYAKGDLIDNPDVIAIAERDFPRHVLRRMRPAPKEG